jgi:hypothetical protein
MGRCAGVRAAAVSGSFCEARRPRGARRATPQLEVVKSVSGITNGQDAQSGEVTITRGMDRSKVFTDWIKQTHTCSAVDEDKALQNVTITVKNAQGEDVRTYTLLNAWASNWTSSDLDASSATWVDERDCCTEVGRRSACSGSCAASAVFVRSCRHDRRSPASGFRGR